MPHSTFRSVVSITGLLLLITAHPPALDAQAVSSASVTGRIMDEQGSIVPSAHIQLTGVNTGAVYTAVSNSDGIYTVPTLPIGAYTLQATVPGFQTYVQT